MADTIAFGGRTVTLSPGLDRPRRAQNLIFQSLPRSNTTIVTNMGTVHQLFTFNGFISDSTTALAMAELAAWQALEGTSGTLTLTIAGTASSYTTCHLLAVSKAGRAATVIPITLSFVKV